MGVTFKVEGLKELGENMKKLSEDLQAKAAQKATYAAAKVVRKKAQELAPIADEPVVQKALGIVILPGNLRKQIIIKRLRKGKDTELTSEHIVTVRGKAKAGFASRYGSMLEYGTVKMSPKPFMRPAFDIEKEHAVEEMAKALKAEIDKVNF